MIITAKQMILGDGATVVQNGALLIKDGLIKDVGNLADLKAKYAGEEVVDHGDSSMLPGLIDMHVHIGATQDRIDSEVYSRYMVGYNALDFVQRALIDGVTTMRDVSSADGLCQSIINASKRGMVKGVPRIFHTNMAISATGGHTWSSESSIECDGENEIRKAVRQQVRAGAEWIKIMTTHRTDGISEYTQEELNVAVDETKRHLRKTAVHATLQPAIEFCINAGFDTIEHGTDINEDQARRMVEKGITWVPTLLVHYVTFERLQKILDECGELTERQWETYNLYKPSNESFRKNLKKYADIGVNIVTGTDMIADGTASVADEMAVMVEYGMDTLSVIATGTSNCAKVLDMEGQIGLLAKGAIADILVVNGNPVEDIKALKNVEAVYFGGERVCR
ncbi:MAG: amidohydrolase family protein [Defluviitaleaceae bacterium]|nr:amidohydrolase family protein [Defluviitaleaceae bacterium]